MLLLKNYTLKCFINTNISIGNLYVVELEIHFQLIMFNRYGATKYLLILDSKSHS